MSKNNTMKNIEKLLRIAQPIPGKFSLDESIFSRHCGSACSTVFNELTQFYCHCNGLFAFESALLIRPSNIVDNVFGLSEWNAETLWKSHYPKTEIDKRICFAEDTFGCQFCTDGHTIEVFDPETGDFEFLCNSLELWAGLIIDNYSYYTGYPLIHEWQKRNGTIRPGFRLCPKQFFILQGEYTIDNLYEINDVEGMQLRGDLSSQLRDLPDGAKIVLKTK